MCILPLNRYFGGLRGLRGLSGLHKASEDHFDVGFEISKLGYPGIHVHIAYNCHLGGLWGHSGLQTASEVKSDLRFEISDLYYLHIHVHIVYMVCLWQPLRSLQPLNSLWGQNWPQICNQLPQLPMWPKFQGNLISQKMTLPGDDDKHGPLTSQSLSRRS